MILSNAPSRRLTGLLAVTLLAAACTTKTLPVNSTPSTGSPSEATSMSVSTGAAIAPTMVVEAFLRAANSKDLDTMAQLYGTKDGQFSRKGTRQEIDDRMFVMASALKHKDYKIIGSEIVPGRRNDQTQVILQITRTDGKQVTVPFVMTRYKDSWLVENINIQKLLQ